jgi:hypothetical protein
MTGNSTLAGYLRDDKTNEPLPGVSVYLEDNQLLVQQQINMVIFHSHFQKAFIF